MKSWRGQPNGRPRGVKIQKRLFAPSSEFSHLPCHGRGSNSWWPYPAPWPEPPFLAGQQKQLVLLFGNYECNGRSILLWLCLNIVEEKALLEETPPLMPLHKIRRNHSQGASLLLGVELNTNLSFLDDKQNLHSLVHAPNILSSIQG